MSLIQNQKTSDIKEEIRSRIDIAQVIGRYVSLRPAGQNLKGLCPFHKEKTPSFTVSPDKGVFHCFGCGKGGDIFTFLMEKEGLSFPETLERMSEETGIPLQNAYHANQSSQKQTISKTEGIKIHEIATRYYYNQMRNNPEVINYFKSRKLSPEIVKEFMLGYAPEGWSNFITYARTLKIDEKKLDACGLVVSSNGAAYDRFRNRIIFPVFDISGRPIAFAGRSMDNETKPKYLNSPETPLYQKNRVLYGLNHARASIKEKGQVIFVEGYMDFLSLYQAGIKNVVATSGTSLTEEHGHLIRRFTAKIILVFDGDSAGVSAAERAIFVLAPLNLDVRVLLLPEEHDPDTFVHQFGAEAFLQQVDRAQSAVSFLIKRTMEQHDPESGTGKAAIIGKLAPLVRTLSDAVIRAECIKQIAQELDIKEDVLHSKLKSLFKQIPQSRTPQNTGDTEAQNYLETEEGNFLHMLLKEPSLIPTVRKYISAETFLENISGKLYSLFTETYDQDKTLKTVFSRTRDAQLIQVLSLMAVKELTPGDLNEEITHKVKRFMLKRYLSKKHTITQLIRTEKKGEVKAQLLQKQKDLITKYGALSKEW